MLAYDAIIHSSIGQLGIRTNDTHLLCIDFLTDNKTFSPKPRTLAAEVGIQLQLYLQRKIQNFNLPLLTQGSDFQNKVWQLLLAIPYGVTMTYGQAAKQLSTSARAIGNACRSNPIPIVIPCHRIIAQNGLGGYSGFTTGPRINMKKCLLELEKKALL